MFLFALDMLQDSLEPSVVPAQNQNDCKLLCTCEVTVERLRAEKIPIKEEQETESKVDATLEDGSSVSIETHSPIVELTTTNVTSCEMASSANVTSSEYDGTQNLCSSPTPEAELNPNSFDDIDFDPNITLDDLCPTSDTDWPDVLELTEAVGRTLACENPVLSDEKATPILSSITVSPTPDQPAVTKSLTDATDISAVYKEIRTSLLDSFNVFNVNWPACFNYQWGAQVEG